MTCAETQNPSGLHSALAGGEVWRPADSRSVTVCGADQVSPKSHLEERSEEFTSQENLKFTLFSKLFSVSPGGKRLIHVVHKQRPSFSTFSHINVKEKNLRAQSPNGSSIFEKSRGDKADDPLVKTKQNKKSGLTPKP